MATTTSFSTTTSSRRLMSTLDISRSLIWHDELPTPNWDVVGTWIERRPEADQAELWNDVARQWFEHLGEAAGEDYGYCEGKRTIVFGPMDERLFRNLTTCGDESQKTLLALLPEIAEFRTPGKLLVLAWNGRDDYYRYVGRFHGEGSFGASAGMHIRDDHPHIALCHVPGDRSLATLAHETTHAALTHLDLPQWIEEGLAQMFENDMAGRASILLTPEQAKKHRRYWHRHGLDGFWFGDCFHRSGDAQELSYELAEILIRLLFSDHRPGWFSTTKQKQLMKFFRAAKRTDGGRDAALDHLEYGIDELAEKFLGPIELEPKADRPRNTTWNADRTN